MRLRFLTLRAHAVIDYASALVAPLIPRMLGWSRPLVRLHDAKAIVSLSTSLLTDYDLGLIKLLPVPAHLAVDAASGAAILGLAAFMPNLRPIPRAAMAGAGLFYLALALCTRTPPRGRRPPAFQEIT